MILLVGLAVEWIRSDISVRTAPATLAILALQAAAAVQLVRRTPVAGSVLPRAWLAVVPSIALSAVLLALAPEPNAWSTSSQVAAVAGAGWAAVSLTVLGRSFALAPAARPLVERGPYRLVRHPAYLGELLLVAAIAGVVPQPPVAAALVAGIFVGIVWRIRVEERLLAADERWARYASRTRYRLLPPIW